MLVVIIVRPTQLGNMVSQTLNSVDLLAYTCVTVSEKPHLHVLFIGVTFLFQYFYPKRNLLYNTSSVLVYIQTFIIILYTNSLTLDTSHDIVES